MTKREQWDVEYLGQFTLDDGGIMVRRRDRVLMIAIRYDDESQAEISRQEINAELLRTGRIMLAFDFKKSK